MIAACFKTRPLASSADSTNFRRGRVDRVLQDDAIASLALGSVEGLICVANDICARQSRLELGNSDRHRYASDRRSSGAHSHLGTLDRRANALGNQLSDLDRFVVQDHGEFLTAIAGDL